MSDAPDVPVASPISEMLDADTPCTSCGYNLRGLQQNQACPECGEDVWRSCQGHLLRYADPEWLDRVRLGVWMLLAGAAFSIVGRGIAAALGAVTAGPASMSAGILLWLGESTLGVCAAMLITSPEPMLSLDEQPVSLRRVTRCAALLSVVGELWELGVLAPFDRAITITITAVGYAAVIVWYFGEFAYLRRLALRIPDKALARRTRIVMWGFFAGTAIAGVTALAALGRLGVGPGGPVTFGVAIIGCVGLVLIFVFMVAYLHMLYQYLRALRMAIEQAAVTPYLKAATPQGFAG